MPNAFQAAVKRCNDRGDRNTAKRIAAEGQICGALVREILARGYSVSVHDGEDFVLSQSRKASDVMAALFSTDMDTLHIYHCATFAHVGWFSLVYGNDGYDVISDYSANAICKSISDAVDATIAKVEARLCR